MLNDPLSLAAQCLLVLICTLVTLTPRALPLYIFSRNTPAWLKAWLNFVPAAVMAALVVPDLFFYGGSFNASPLDNLFLLAGLCTIVFCAVTKNFVATIVFGMAFVAAARYFGLGA